MMLVAISVWLYGVSSLLMLWSKVLSMSSLLVFVASVRVVICSECLSCVMG